VTSEKFLKTFFALHYSCDIFFMAGYFQFFRTNPHSVVQVRKCYALSKNSWERPQTRAVRFFPVY